MAYYLVQLTHEKCRCGAKATHRMHRSGSDGRGYYCKRHGEAAVKYANETEARLSSVVPNVNATETQKASE